ncbi:MAG: gamma-glutamyl-gamma-aminobutyrate hydrolase family protein [Acidaminococcaceae bacterium]|nr:gamma-glutamyl-gamma-aminobutyrate hydrolase family protein [Acidaminococcaceae bacterium]
MKNGIMKRIATFIFMVVVAVCMTSPAFAAKMYMANDTGKPIIGISWKANTQNYEKFKKVIEAAGGIPVELKQVISKGVIYNKDGSVDAKCLMPSGMLRQYYANKIKSRNYAETNVAEVMEGVDGVFFTGGEDISPSLFKVPQAETNCGEEINATRDISDYTLWAYCIDKNIPAIGACRGEQMLGIVSGCKFTQDIPTYYAKNGAKYHDTHRMPVGAKNRTYARHDVELTTMNSHLYKIVGSMKLKNVSSWHHQAIFSIYGTDLIQTAKTTANGINIIEGVENPHKLFCVGVQFHPENDCSLAIAQGKPEAALCNVDICLNFFKTLVKYAGEAKK